MKRKISCVRNNTGAAYANAGNAAGTRTDASHAASRPVPAPAPGPTPAPPPGMPPPRAAQGAIRQHKCCHRSACGKYFHASRLRSRAVARALVKFSSDASRLRVA